MTMKKKLMAGLLVFTMIVSSAMPVMAATRAKRIYIEGKKYFLTPNILLGVIFFVIKKQPFCF